MSKDLAKHLREVKGKYLVDEKNMNYNEVEAQLDNEMKEVEAMQEKATPLNSGQTGGGEEFIPTAQGLPGLIDVAGRKDTFLGALSEGFQGSNLQLTTELPIAGEYGNIRGGEEWDTSSSVYANGTPIRKPNTDRATIVQKKLIFTAGVSDKLQTFSIVDVLAWLQRGMSQQFLFDIEDIVLNADSSAGSTGNINSDDQLATTTFADGALDRRYFYDDGLRKQPVNGSAGVDYLDVGAPSTDDIFTLAGYFRNDVDPSDRILIMDNATYHAFMKLSDFKDLSINGRQSTITTGALTNIAGMDLFVTRNMRKTEADGKLSGATPANNTKGQIVIAKRNVIQHGFGAPLKTQFIEDIERGVLFKAVQYFGFDNINKKGSVSEPSIVAGINVTV